MKKVSVVVPVYNVEEYIERCVRSITAQSYENLEIILVDDGSKDQSGDICKTLEKEDKRIHTIQQGNMGLSGARNAGIKAATGEYCMFVDGDDWLDPECIEKTVKEIDQGYDMILFPFKKEYHSNRVVNVHLFKRQRDFSAEEVRNYLLRRLFGPICGELKRPINMDHLSTAWGKLYRLKTIRELRFVDTKKIGTEDMWFNIHVFFCCEKIKYIDSVFYHYYKANQNALTRTYKPDLSEKWKLLYSMQADFIKEKKLGRDFEEALNNRRILNLVSLVLNIGLSDLTWKNKNKELKILLEDKYYEVAFRKFSYSNLPLKWKAFYWLCDKKGSAFLLLACFLFQILNRMRGSK